MGEENNKHKFSTWVLLGMGFLVVVTVFASSIDGFGTANYVAKFSSGGVITNSLIFDDGENVSIDGNGLVVQDSNVSFNNLDLSGNAVIDGYAIIGDYILLGGSILNAEGLNVTGIVNATLGVYGRDIHAKYQQGYYSTYSTGADSQIIEIDTGDANTGASGVANVNKFGFGLNGIQIGNAVGGFACSNVAPQSCLIRTNSTTPMYFSGSSRVGVGTTSPLQKFHVDGNVLIGKVSGSAGLFEVQDNKATTYSAGMASTTTVRNIVTNSNTTNNNVVEYALSTYDTAGTFSSGIRLFGIFTSHAPSAISADFAIVTKNAGTFIETARFMSNGNVGIGAVNASSKLYVNGSGITFDRAGNFGQYQDFYRNGIRTWQLHAGINSGQDNMQLRNESLGSVITFLQNGSVGIGTNSPTSKLHVNGTITTNLTGTGNDYVCVDANGVLYRSDGVCA